MSYEVEFTANPTQRAFIESRAEADLFASRKGEGKSAGLCWAAFYYTYHNPGAQGVVLRDTWENLRRTTLDEWFRWFPDGICGQWVGTNREWHWNPKKTGLEGKVTFLGAESSDDAQRLASMPLAFILMDEPAPAGASSQGIDKFVFDTAMAQLRQPGMKWYACKLATNNPDQSHWTYKEFVKPGTPADPNAVPGVTMPIMQESGYRAWQPREPENVQNLPPGYYEAMAKRWSDRKDLLRRFVEGKFGFQSKGKAVTPEWNDDIHLASGLQPVSGLPLHLGWDGGLNPTCIISQVTPLGDWLILDALTDDGIGVFELIEDVVKPTIAERYEWVQRTEKALRHTGDPAMQSAEQSRARRAGTNEKNSASNVILHELGGSWTPGPTQPDDRIEPLRAVMRKQRQGRGLMVVDRDRAEAVWYALRGGWHYRINRQGVVGSIVKDEHSHPGDAISYLAAKLFPGGRVAKHGKTVESKVGGYYNTAPGGKQPFIGSKGRVIVPKEAQVIGDDESARRTRHHNALRKELPNKL